MLGDMLKQSSSEIFHWKNVFYDAKSKETTNFQKNGEVHESSSSISYLCCEKML